MSYYIGTVEEYVMNPNALPERMRGFRRYRIEYGGHAQYCDMECTFYAPPDFDIYWLEDKLNEATGRFCSCFAALNSDGTRTCQACKRTFIPDNSLEFPQYTPHHRRGYETAKD